MNDIFSLQRTFRILKSEIFAFRKQYLFYAIFAAAYTATLLLTQRTNLHPEVFAILGCILIVIAPFMLYNDIYHKIKGVNYAMLPASNFEKWVAFWIQNVIIIPSIIAILWLILSEANLLFFNIPINFHIDWKSAHKVAIMGILGGQAISMAGVMSFRRLKWIKTMGIIFVFQLALLLITRLFIFQFNFQQYMVQGHAFNIDEQIVWWMKDYISIVMYAIFPLGLWLVSFFKLQEQEM